MRTERRSGRKTGRRLTMLLVLVLLLPLARAGRASGGGSTLWTWGDNQYGELGNGTFTTSSPYGVATPAEVPGFVDVNGVASIAGGSSDTYVIKSDGTLWAWGNNANGQLGNGTFTSSATPAQVPGLTGVTAVSAGGSGALALESNGTVWAWGNNVFGQLGNGSYAPLGDGGDTGGAPYCDPSPAQIPGLTDVVAISAGAWHSLALKSDGTVWAWGFNFDGQLGNGRFTWSSPYGIATPAQVPGLTGIVAVQAGEIHSLALKSDGTVWAWGDNSVGELGNGTFTGVEFEVEPIIGSSQGIATPARVPGLTNVVAIPGGNGFSEALKSDGTVWTWGYNGDGELGNGSFTTGAPYGVATPEPVPGLSGIVEVGAHLANHSLALRNDGALWAWGENDFGELGDGTFTTGSPDGIATPVQVPGRTSITQVAAGAWHSMVLTGGGNAPPTFGTPVVGTNGFGQTTASVTVQDACSGLASVTVVKESNCTLVVAGNTVSAGGTYTFPAGPTLPELVVATKINQSASASFTLLATGAGGATTTFDPVIVTLRIPTGSTSATRVLRSIPAAEHCLTVVNGNPGVASLSVDVNGRRKAASLTDGQQVTDDLASVFHPGTNTVTLAAGGRSGESVIVMLADAPRGLSAARRSADVSRNDDWGF